MEVGGDLRNAQKERPVLDMWQTLGRERSLGSSEGWQGDTSQKEQNAAWRATGLAPGVQRSEGLWESRWQEAPLHQGPLQTGLHFKVTARGTFGELPWPLPNHSEYFCCKLLQKTNFCMAKEIETHRQASQNTQTTI